jgi:hypothetical protein
LRAGTDCDCERNEGQGQKAARSRWMTTSRKHESVMIRGRVMGSNPTSGGETIGRWI